MQNRMLAAICLAAVAVSAVLATTAPMPDPTETVEAPIHGVWGTGPAPASTTFTVPMNVRFIDFHSFSHHANDMTIAVFVDGVQQRIATVRPDSPETQTIRLPEPVRACRGQTISVQHNVPGAQEICFSGILHR